MTYGHLKHSPDFFKENNMETLFAPDPWVRLPLYSALGLLTEVLFTGITDLIYPNFLQSWNVKNLDGHKPNSVRRDPRAVGYTFLWMVPIYATLIVIEPLSQWLQDVPMLARGLIYLALFWIGEYFSGALIKKISGYNPWDYSYSRFSVHGHIRWDFGPLWYGFTLMLEYFSHKFIALTPAVKAVF
jgi:hypothetical protein